MSRLTFQEKMLWAQVLALLGVGVFYVHFLHNAAPGHHYFHAVILGVLLVFGSVSFVARRRAGNVVEDERDRSIAAIGARWSNVILWVGLVLILVLYWDHGSLRSAGLLIGLIFHLLLLAGIARIVRELVAYRMTV
jgi:O-antigen ligase